MFQFQVFKWDLFNISFEMTVECPITPIITGTIVTFVKFHNDLISRRGQYTHVVFLDVFGEVVVVWNSNVNNGCLVRSFINNDNVGLVV